MDLVSRIDGCWVDRIIRIESKSKKSRGDKKGATTLPTEKAPKIFQPTCLAWSFKAVNDALADALAPINFWLLSLSDLKSLRMLSFCPYRANENGK